MITVGHLLAKSLYDRGVRTVSGLPGGEVVELLDAFRKADIEVDDIQSCEVPVRSALAANALVLLDVQVNPAVYPTAVNK
jgi:thiamine pyrophosphate-dependent acetolactate synthase large subunit-like protein